MGKRIYTVTYHDGKGSGTLPATDVEDAKLQVANLKSWKVWARWDCKEEYRGYDGTSYTVSGWRKQRATTPAGNSR